MGDLHGSDSQYRASETNLVFWVMITGYLTKTHEKCHVMITGLVNKSFGSWKIKAPSVRWDGTTDRVSRRGWPISRGKLGLYK